MHVPQQLFHSLVLPSSTPLSDQHLQPFVNKDFLPLSPSPPPPPPLPPPFLRIARSFAASIVTHSVHQNPSDVLCSDEVLD